MSTYAWHVPDGFLGDPGDVGDTHESVCMTNDTDRPAEVTFTAYFNDRAPQRCAGFVLGPQRNRHLRTDAEALRPLGLRKGEPYGLRLQSSIPLHVQYSRLVQHGANTTLMTTMVPRVDDRGPGALLPPSTPDDEDE